MDDFIWADTTEEFNKSLGELTQGDGCSYWASCVGDDACPFEDCLLASDDKWEILGRYCLELEEEGLTNKQIGKRINRSVDSVVRYKNAANSEG